YRDQPDDEVTLEDVCNKLIVWGTPDKVTDEILEFQDEVGEFGTLLYAGKDWASPELARRSMILAAEKVMPVVTAATNDSRKNKTAAE
ncbi:MAG: LLM class flavin-dependent oxidoreductase, partial [Alphaproteobacteria bacterium]